MKRLLVTGLACAAAAAMVSCSDSTANAITQLNLDRPIDISFACYGGLRITNGMSPTPQQPIELTAQPLEACAIRSGPHDPTAPVPVPPGQEDLRDMGGAPVAGAAYYAFILQGEPGTVAVAQWDTKPSSAFAGGDITMLDSDPLTPGKNGITVGEDPIAIASDNVGCHEVVANAGSCDLSVLDVNSALANKAVVDRLEVKNASGQVLRARPAAMVAEPASGTIGFECPATATGLVYVAYPSCHLVAAIDSSSGTVVAGIQFAADGTSSIVDGNVSCPDDCSARALPTPGPRPVTVDLKQDPRTSETLLAIGAENSNVLTMVPLDSQFRPTSIQKVPLEDHTGTLGISQVKIAPQIGMGGTGGVINDDTSLGGQSRFVYAVTNDTTIHVVDSLVNRECDTQIDPRYLHDVQDVRKLSCLPIGDPKLPRRPLAKGPGIELVGGQVPVSIDIFKVDPIAGDSRLAGNPLRLIGYFGVISSLNGGTFLLNVDNDDAADFIDPADVLGTQIPLDIANQLRDDLPNRGELATTTVNGMVQQICNDSGPDPDAQGGNSGGPRSPAAPQRSLPAGTLASEKVGELPSLRQVLCTGTDETKPVAEVQFAAPVPVRESVFPDLRGLRGDEQWTFTWEGSLSQDKADSSVDGPAVREAQMYVDGGGMHVVDQTRPFCDAGVEDWDVLQMRGCDPSLGDAQCPAGYTCYVHPNSPIAGLGSCMLADEAERLANACKSFLTSLRRYTIRASTSGQLELVPRKHALRTTPVDGCTGDDQCKTLADYAARLPNSTEPGMDATADTHTWSCAVDPARKPDVDGMGNPKKVCLETCSVDADCQTGTVCDAGYCMEGVTPPQACVNAPQRFELRAADAFTAIGTRSGYVHSVIQNASGRCVKDPSANPLQIGRIPLRAPACDPTADPRTGRRADGTYEPNPCQLTVDESEFQTNYLPGTCTVGTPAQNLATRQATAIRFRNRGMQLTFVDPTYPGDGACIGDRMGNLGNVPIVTPGFQITFRQTAGFTPLPIQIQPSMPVKVTRGPLESIWVIDAGDFLSTSITTPSTRGKVYRIESPAIAIINVLE